MKQIIILLFVFIWTHSFAQSSKILEKPRVDERVELLSIVFRLAESDEYSSEIFKLYTDKINAHYGSFKNHELIRFIKKLRKDKNVGYEAVMMMAVHIDSKLNPLIEFTDATAGSWGKDNAYRFIRLLKKFYKDTGSKAFFKSNQGLYEEVSKRFLPVYEHLDLAWYTSFYGKEPNEKFVIINGVGNGAGNYAASFNATNGKRQVYAIMGTTDTDSTGMAIFPVDRYFPTLVHEFNHSFVNLFLDKDPGPFKKSGEIIYKVVASKMNNGGYGSWQSMLIEAQVRAAVIKYMKDHKFPENDISREVNEQKYRGFLWIEELVAELESYDRQRNNYPTLESYLPNLAKAYDIYAKNMNTYVENYAAKRPAFVSLNEFINGDQNVDSSIKQITINFDKPFSGAQFIAPGKDGKAFPNIKSLSYSDDKKSAILGWALQSNTEYQFILIGLSPKTSEDKSNGNYEINFKTK